MKGVTLSVQVTRPSNPSLWVQNPILTPTYLEERKVPLCKEVSSCKLKSR